MGNSNQSIFQQFENIFKKQAEEETDNKVLEAIFHTSDPEEIFSIIDQTFEKLFKAGCAEILFLYLSVGFSAGVKLKDGNTCFIKFFRQEKDSADLEAEYKAIKLLEKAEIPIPRYYYYGESHNGLLFLISDYHKINYKVDYNTEEFRSTFFRYFTDIPRALSSLADQCQIGEMKVTAELWPKPHNEYFDFTKTFKGAEWIDELRKAAIDKLLLEKLEPWIHSADFSFQNLSFKDNKVELIYDLDSLRKGDKHLFIGNCSCTYIYNWVEGPERVTSIEDILYFIDNYQKYSGESWDRHDYNKFGLSLIWSTLYQEKCRCMFPDYDLVKRKERILCFIDKFCPVLKGVV